MYLPSIIKGFHDDFESAMGDVRNFSNGFKEKDGKYVATFLEGKEIDINKLEITQESCDKGYFLFSDIPALKVSYETDNFKSCSIVTLPHNADLSTIEAELTDNGVIITINKKSE